MRHIAENSDIYFLEYLQCKIARAHNDVHLMLFRHLKQHLVKRFDRFINCQLSY